MTGENHVDGYDRFVAELRRFVKVQGALLAALRAVAGGDERRVGEVTVQGERWTFARHGGGVMFHEPASGRRIDAHDKIDRPGAFDVWRLSIYFGSLQRTGVKMLERAIGRSGMPVKEALDVVLQRCTEAGVVSVADGALVLAVGA